MKSFFCVDFNNVCFFPYSLLSFQRYLRMLHGIVLLYNSLIVLLQSYD